MTGKRAMRRSAVACALVTAMCAIGNVDVAAQEPQTTGSTAPIKASKETARVRLLNEQKSYKAAYLKGRELIPVFEEQFGAQSLELADLLDQFLVAWYSLGTDGTPQMLTLAERALTIREARVPADDRSLLEPLRQVASVLCTRIPKGLLWSETRKRAVAAVGYKRRVLAIEQVGVWQQDAQVVRDIGSLGGTLVGFVGSFESVTEGARLFDELVGLYEKNGGRNAHGLDLPLQGRAGALWRLGDFDGALRDYRRALELVRNRFGPTAPRAIELMNGLGNTLFFSGDYGEALKLHQNALALEEGSSNEEWNKQGDGRYWWISNTLNSLGLLNYELGLLPAARAYLERGLRIENHAPPIEGNLGRVYYAMGDLKRARELFEAEIVRSEDTFWICTALGDVLVAQGERSEAADLYRRALKSVERQQGPAHFYMLDPLKGLARLQADAGNLEDAERLLLQALAIAEKTFGPKSPRVAAVLAELARLHAKAGNATKALDEALRAESLSRDHLRLTSRSLSEREALRFGAARTSTMDLLLSLAAEKSAATPNVGPLAWDALVRSRALVLDEMAARHVAVDSTNNAEVGRLAESLATARARLARLVVLGPQGQDAELYRHLVDTATDQKDRSERELAARSERFNRSLARAEVGLQNVLGSLPPGAMLVGYGRYEAEGGARYVAFVGAAGKAPAVIPLGGASDIDARVAEWRAAVLASSNGAQTSRAAYLEAGQALRAAIWDPVAPALEGATRVFVVPDGTLGLVSLAALPAVEGGYVIEHGPLLHLVSAERDLASLAPRADGRGMLAMGAPAYDAVATAATPRPAEASASSAAAAPGTALLRGAGNCPGYADLVFSALPETKTEVDEVAAVWAEGRERPANADKTAGRAEIVTDLSGAEATEAAFKALAPGRRVVHLATHGFFLGDRCQSALPRTRGIGGLVDSENSPRAATPGDSPLLLAGLALAGANRRASAAPGDEDGVLTAEEIAGIDLSSADWVVLSGCETGVGTIAAGEGVLGLRRAVQIAGARTLIMSLWPVEDLAAREWMSALYRARWVAGVDSMQAVRTASLEVLNARRAAGKSDVPFFWGPFVAAGSP